MARQEVRLRIDCTTDGFRAGPAALGELVALLEGRGLTLDGRTPARAVNARIDPTPSSAMALIFDVELLS